MRFPAYFLFALVLLVENTCAAERVYVGKDIDTVKAAILESLLNIKFDIDQDTGTHLVMSKEIAGLSGFGIRLLNNLGTGSRSNYASSENPRIEAAFTFIKRPEGVKVVANSSSTQQLENGNVRRDRIADEGLMEDVLERIERKFSGRSSQSIASANAQAPVMFISSAISP